MENIQILKEKIGFEISEPNGEIFSLYECMNGKKEDRVSMLMSGFIYLTIEQVIKEFDYLKTVDIVLEVCDTSQIQKRV